MSQDFFFTSDEHYGHRSILGFCNRPFSDIYEMEEELIKRHNAKVPKGGLTFHLGDMFWRTHDNPFRVLDRLNGQHAYVYGNHCELIESRLDVRQRFTTVKDILEVKLDKLPKIVLFHYPMRTWNGSHRGSWHLYGHVHGELPENDSLSFDVGVDCWNYEPVSLQEVAIKMLPKMEKLRKLDLLRGKKD